MPSTICPICEGWMHEREIGDNYGVGYEWVCDSCGHVESGEYHLYDELGI